MKGKVVKYEETGDNFNRVQRPSVIAYPEEELEGDIEISNMDEIFGSMFPGSKYPSFLGNIEGVLGVQIARDGRIWVCINGIAFIRFKPKRKEANGTSSMRSGEGMHEDVRAQSPT